MIRRRLLKGALLIGVAFNLTLSGLYVLGRGGQTTTLAIVNRGSAYQVFIDGQQMIPQTAPGAAPAPVQLDAPPSGSVTIMLPLQLVSMPRPSGVDSVVISSPDGTDVYFRDDFDFLNYENWEVTSGLMTVDGGVLVARSAGQQNVLTLKGRGWQDYRLELTFRNGRSGTIGVHAGEDGGVFYTFDLVRDFPNYLEVYGREGRKAMIFGGFVHVDKSEVVESLAAMTAGAYPALVLAVLAGVGGVFVLAQIGRLLPLRLPELRLAGLARRASPAHLAVLLAAAAFAATLYVNVEYYEGIPHVPDEVSYIFQARLFAAGRLAADVPPVKDAFQFYFPTFVYDNDEVWASVYTFGQPIVLTPGALLGVLWLVPPLIGAGCVLLVYAIGRSVYGTFIGLVAAFLFAGSPFFLMQASNFMSHSTLVFFVLLAWLLVLRPERSLFASGAAGFFLAMAGNTRPLEALVVAPFIGIVFIGVLWRNVSQRTLLRHAGAFIIGVAIVGAAFLLYNWGVTGDPLQAPFAKDSDASGVRLGFVNGHTLDVGLRNEQAQLSALILVLNGWPAYVGLVFAFLPFLLGTRNRWDYFCLAAALAVMGVYVFYRFSGVYEGPRYWYAALPFLVLLSARGAQMLAAFLSALAAEAGWTLGWVAPYRQAGALVVALVVGVLYVHGSGGWLFGWNGRWTEASLPLVPETASAVRGVFGVDDRLLRLKENVPLENALVLVKPCTFFTSVHCYGTVFNENALDWNGNVVWTRYIAGENARTIAAFPGRTVWVANWDGEPSIVPFDAAADR